MDNSKAWFLSKTVWGVAVMALAAILQQFGVGSVSAADQASLVELILQTAQVAGAVLAIFGRAVANQRLSIK